MRSTTGQSATEENEEDAGRESAQSMKREHEQTRKGRARGQNGAKGGLELTSVEASVSPTKPKTVTEGKRPGGCNYGPTLAQATTSKRRLPGSLRSPTPTPLS
jgi:hypothetical protein